MEHRCGHRRIVHVKVRVSTRGGLSGYGCLIEASGSGARLVTPLALSLHSIVILIFDDIKTGECKRLRLEAEVIRCASNGYGIEWTQFAPTGLRLIYQSPLLEAERGSTTMTEESPAAANRGSAARG